MIEIEETTLPRHLVEEAFEAISREIDPEWKPWHLTIQVPKNKLFTTPEELQNYFTEIGMTVGKALLVYEYDMDRFNSPNYSRMHLHCLLYAPESIVDLISAAQRKHGTGLYKITTAWDLKGLINYLGKQLDFVRELPKMQLLTFRPRRITPITMEPNSTPDAEGFFPKAVQQVRPDLYETEDTCREMKNSNPLLGGKSPSILSTAWGKTKAFVGVILQRLRALFPLPRDK